MIKLNIHQAKTHLSRYLNKLLEGETILLCKRNEPIAEIRRIKKPCLDPRPIGLAKSEFTVPDSFFEPLPEKVLEVFEGK